MSCRRLEETDVAAFAVEPHASEWAEFREHFPSCAECSREVARFAALTRALADEGSETSAHLSEEQVVALASPSPQLASDERARLEAHLRGCAPCRTELAVARRFDHAVVPPPATQRRRLRWVPAFGAAAAMLLAVLAATLLWRVRDTGTTSAPAPIAQIERPAPIVPAPPVVAREEKAPPPVPVTPAKPVPGAKQPPKQDLAQERPPEPPREILVAALVPKDPPLYAAGALANAPLVRISSEARSLGRGAPTPEALGPAHVGATSHESPSLYFFLSEPTSDAIEVTVTNPTAIAPLLETTLPAPLAAGLHRVSLAEHRARLEPSVDYRWFVALVRDPERRAQDAVSVAGIRYTPPDPELRERIAAGPPANAAHLYAESGLWYDAFDQLSTWLATEQDAALLHSHRAALLEQVGLGDAAAFERRAAAP